jgi:hypothetical protein
MYRLLNDLRIVRLALHMEEVFERYEENLRSLIPHVPVRARLAPLFEDGPGHEALRRMYADLSREASRSQAEAEPEDLLQTLFECETAAHEFYVYYLDRLSDPRLVHLFQQLRDEEAGHMRIVQEAMMLLGTLPRRVRPSRTEA